MMAISLFVAWGLFLVWFSIDSWYFRQVDRSRQEFHHPDGKTIPGETPKLLVGNLMQVYRAKNHLSAYLWFHEQFGEIVQIFWMWRQQISITNYHAIRHILVENQKNYSKFPPNSLIQRLYGRSVLTNDGEDWKRHRLLLNEVFSKQRVADFHDIFVDYTERLAAKWQRSIQDSGGSVQLNIYPELTALFLDLIGQISIGKNFAALEGGADELLYHLKYVVHQSTRPVHQFAKWWQNLPLPSNRKLSEAFAAIDDLLYKLIQQRKEISETSITPSSNVLDLLLQATNTLEDEVQRLTEQEVRDNLLAILLNGHETVATSVSLSLYLLAQNPEKLARAQAEVDRIAAQDNGKFTKAGLSALDYLQSVIVESLRLRPPVAGLQRISSDRDILAGWSIPAGQAVGITLMPLHQNPEYFGERPEQFHPERYLDRDLTVASVNESQRQCPFKRFLTSHREDSNTTAKTGVCLPLTFGDGARKCLGEHLAMYEMKVALAVLLYHFDFQIAPNFEAELELGKFGLFLTNFPKGGVEMAIKPRIH
jgi:cytochrome P450